MKTSLKTEFTAAVIRAVVWFEMRSVEITLDGMLKSREAVSDPFTRARMAPAIANARREALDLREKYIALRPRQSWRMAA